MCFIPKTLDPFLYIQGMFAKRLNSLILIHHFSFRQTKTVSNGLPTQTEHGLPVSTSRRLRDAPRSAESPSVMKIVLPFCFTMTVSLSLPGPPPHYNDSGSRVASCCADWPSSPVRWQSFFDPPPVSFRLPLASARCASSAHRLS